MQSNIIIITIYDSTDSLTIRFVHHSTMHMWSVLKFNVHVMLYTWFIVVATYSTQKFHAQKYFLLFVVEPWIN